MLIKDLDLLSITYLKKYKLILITFILQSYKQAYIINKYFNNLCLTDQVKIIYMILDEEKTQLHTLIKCIYK